MISDTTVVLAFIALVSAIVAGWAAIGKINASAKLQAQNQSHERAMTELKAKQNADTNLSAALLSVASAMQAQVDVQGETNRRHEKERVVADAQAQQFVATVVTIAAAETALTNAVSANTTSVAELGTQVTTLATSVQEALTELRHGVTDWKKVVGVLERVEIALNKQAHDAANSAQVAALLEANKRRTGELAIVTPLPENGSSD